MGGIYLGIVVVLFSFGLFGLSWLFFRKGNYKLSIAFLVLGGLMLRVYTSCDFYLHEWDERYHALVAKNLIDNPVKPMLYKEPLLSYDYKNWVENHIWVHKQPVPLWTMASSLYLFGCNEIALRLPSIILSTAGIWMTYFIGKRIFDRNTGYFAAFLFAINGLIIELTAGRVATDHIDLFFLFFILLSIVFTILFSEKKIIVFNILIGISVGLAILTKWLPALIILALWVPMLWNSKKFAKKEIILHFLILLITITTVALPWQLYIFNEFPLESEWESITRYKHLSEVIEGRTGPFYYFFHQIRISYGELIYLPVGWFIWMLIKNPKEVKYATVTIWFLIPFIFFSSIVTKMQAYILFTAPALFIMTGEFYFYLRESWSPKIKQKWFLYLLLAGLIVLPIRYSIERIKPFSREVRSPEWAENLKKLNDLRVENGVLFNCDKYIEAMFYTEYTAYEKVPDIETIDLLQSQGYTILINENENAPDYLKQDDQIIWVEI